VTIERKCGEEAVQNFTLSLAFNELWHFPGRGPFTFNGGSGRVRGRKMEGMLSALFLFCVLFFFILYDIFYHFSPVPWMPQHKAKGVCVCLEPTWNIHQNEWKEILHLTCFHCYFTVFSDHVCGCQRCYYSVFYSIPTEKYALNKNQVKYVRQFKRVKKWMWIIIAHKNSLLIFSIPIN